MGCRGRLLVVIIERKQKLVDIILWPLLQRQLRLGLMRLLLLHLLLLLKLLPRLLLLLWLRRI